MAKVAAASQGSGPLETFLRWLIGPAIPAWLIAFLRIFDTTFGTVDVLQAAADSLTWLFQRIPLLAVLAGIAPYLGAVLRFVVDFFQRAYELLFYGPLDWLFGLFHVAIPDFLKDVAVGIVALVIMTIRFAIRRHLAVRLAARKRAEALKLQEGSDFAYTGGIGAGAVIGLILGGPIGAAIGALLGGTAAGAVEGGDSGAAWRAARIAELSTGDVVRGAFYSIGSTVILLGIFFAARTFQ
jgi:hypothetical protein